MLKLTKEILKDLSAEELKQANGASDDTTTFASASYRP